ncbi:MAG: RAMP superfamily CRISPR-associated protein [Candidatus Competibacter denitrificans]
MMIEQQRYTVRFVTPAFLGDAEQNGAWRTPPFKALIRQWWRVVAAKDHRYDPALLRETEGRLFGNAWLDKNFSQSQIRLRLDNWKNGQLKQWPIPDSIIKHPEVKNKKTGSLQPIGAELYLGYGPLNFQQGNTKLKANVAIQADECAELVVIFPKVAQIEKTLQLTDWFGTLGSRSRNGWGSLELSRGETIFEPLEAKNSLLQEITRPLPDCFTLDWPHAVGSDQNGLLAWKTKSPIKDWRAAMVELAKIKIAFRTALHFDPNRSHRIDQRHVIAYPVTHHNFNPWGNQSRLANQLRFKVAKTTQGYIGVAYHLPCGIPNELLNTLSTVDRAWIIGEQLCVWQKVHGILDQQMQRI